MTRRVLSLAGLVLTVVAGCSTGEVEAPPASGAVPASEARKEESQVVAQVNDAVITLSDFRRSLARAPGGRAELSPQRYLQALIDEELLVQEAERRRLGQATDLEQSLHRETRLLALRELYSREGISLDPPTDEEMRAYFESSPYRQRVRFSALMVSSAEQIPAILEELESGAEFEAVSMKFSQDSRILARNADMGFHRWATTSPAYRPVADMAFSTAPGEIGGPLEAADGHFLIKVTEVRPVSFEVERDAIERLMVEERLARPLADYYDRLRQEYDLQIDEDGLAALAAELVDPSASSQHHGHHGGGHSSGHHEGHVQMSMTASDDDDPSAIVVTFRGDSLSLAQCRTLLRKSRKGAYPTIEALRNHLTQVASREALAVHEILRLELLQTANVQDGLARARRRLLLRRMREKLTADAAPADENKEQLYYEIHRERYLVSGEEPGLEAVLERVRADYLRDMREKLFQLALGRLRKRYENGIVVYDDLLQQGADLWRQETDDERGVPFDQLGSDK